jgi:hypothetical protein
MQSAHGRNQAEALAIRMGIAAGSTSFRNGQAYLHDGKTRFCTLILGGAALQRCGNHIVLNPALAAEVALSARELPFLQTAGFIRIS